MTINVGSVAIGGVNLGIVPVKSVYAGASLVWRRLTTLPTATVSDTSARVSFRTSSAATVAVKYAASADLSGATTTAGVVVDATTDFTGKVGVAGLASDAAYFYTILIDGVDQLTAPYPTFKTFPANGSAAVFKFAFGSCTMHNSVGADTIFDAVPPDARFLMHLGDVIYADRDTPTTAVLAGYRTKHRDVLAGSSDVVAGWKALRQRTPVFAMLDDHDIINNADGSTSRSTVSQAKQAFSEYAARSNPDSMTTGELYYAFQVGDVGFFVPDCRTYRSANSATDTSSKTILGATQKTALKAWLLANKDTLKVKFICASTPMHGYAANTGADSWGGIDDGTQAPNGANGFRTERNEIWDFIDANQIPGVVAISGDQHWAGSFKTTYAGRPRYEFGASPFNMTNTPTFMLPAVARTADPVNGPVLWKKDNTLCFGVVTVDTTATPATVSFQLYGTSGALGASYLTSITSDQINASLVPAPSISMAATLPSATVGAAYTGSVTATNQNGATGTITITASNLPAGLTAGTQVDNGGGSWTLPITGTPTTSGAFSATFGATNGTQSASYPWGGSVNAGSGTSPHLVQQKGTYYTGALVSSNTVALDHTATVGNTLLLTAVTRSGVTKNTPAGFTLAKTTPINGTGTGILNWYTKVSDGTETSITYTWGSASFTNGFAVQEWEGAIAIGSFTTATISSGSVGTTNSFGPSDAPPDANAVPSMFAELTQTQVGLTCAVSAPWVADGSTPAGAAYAVTFIGTQPAPNAAVSTVITCSAVPTGGIYYGNIWISKA